jgi:hypothetical protein
VAERSGDTAFGRVGSTQTDDNLPCVRKASILDPPSFAAAAFRPFRTPNSALPRLVTRKKLLKSLAATPS